MKKEGYYSSGEFAKMAKVTLRTIRYYDKQNLLKPSYVNEHGARFYTDGDLMKLQQILLFKYLGFSLSEIREMTLDHPDRHVLLNSLDIQLKLVKDRMEQMQLVEQAIQETADTIRQEKQVDWHQMMELIHLTSMEKSLKNQYLDASNISARIRLHELYSRNGQGWFPWLFEQCQLRPGMKVLEIGCGDGTLWSANQKRLPESISVTLSDISEGMLRDARRNLSTIDNKEFSYVIADAHHLPFEEESFDLVIANHVLFYLDKLPDVLEEIRRVLKT
ncbi:MAG: MerR family transcriptional regulator, partial [Eubacterium sp.]|nr:MerR family transcriptional regulator [Eubacterium sp.]